MSSFGVMQHLKIETYDSVEQAIAAGLVYREPVKPIEIDKVVVVNKGTSGGNSTVDLVLRDQQGQLFVVMLTGNLLKSIPC